MALRKSSEPVKSEPVNESAKKAAESDSGIGLDRKLVEIREAEAKRNDVELAVREDATLDPALVKLRDLELKRGDRVIK